MAGINEFLSGILGNGYSNNKYILFFISLIGVYILSKIFVFIAKQVFLKAAQKTKTKIDDDIIEQTNRPLLRMLVIFGLKFSFNILFFTEKVIDKAAQTTKYSVLEIINNSCDTLIIIYLSVIIIRVLNIFLKEWGRSWAKKTKSSIDDELLPIFRKVIKIVVIVMAIIFILKRWEIDVSGLLAGVGIAGLAISFAVKDSLANIFGGISLILDKSFKVGDIIKLESGESGKIHDVGLRSTRIKNWDGEIVIIPNSVMATSKLYNVMQPNLEIRITVDFGVAYGTDIERVKKIVGAEIKKVKGVSKEHDVIVRFALMGESSLDFKALFWVDDLAHKWDIHQKVISNIYAALNKNKINIPFPTRSIYIEQNEPQKKKKVAKKKAVKKRGK